MDCFSAYGTEALHMEAWKHKQGDVQGDVSVSAESESGKMMDV